METTPNKVFLNDIQQEVMYIGAKDTVLCAGRALGKGVIHAMYNLRNFQRMPRSITGFVVANCKRGLTNTLPSMLVHSAENLLVRGNGRSLSFAQRTMTMSFRSITAPSVILSLRTVRVLQTRRVMMRLISTRQSSLTLPSSRMKHSLPIEETGNTLASAASITVC